VQDSGTNSSARPSPLQPLQVHAYPSKTGAKTKHPAARVTNVDGEVADPPTLPESIDVDVVSTPYTTSETVITTGQPAFLNKVDVEGLVRGTGVDLRRASLRETTVHQSELTLTPQETTAETVTVEVKLLDANTGDPIQTANRNGTILLQNQSIETNAAGTTVVTVPARPGGPSLYGTNPLRGGRLSRPISKARIRSTSRGRTSRLSRHCINSGFPSARSSLPCS